MPSSCPESYSWRLLKGRNVCLRHSRLCWIKAVIPSLLNCTGCFFLIYYILISVSTCSNRSACFQYFYQNINKWGSSLKRTSKQTHNSSYPRKVSICRQSKREKAQDVSKRVPSLNLPNSLKFSYLTVTDLTSACTSIWTTYFSIWKLMDQLTSPLAKEQTGTCNRVIKPASEARKSVSWLQCRAVCVLLLQIPPAPPRPDFDASREKLQKLGEGEGSMTKEEFTKMKQELEAWVSTDSSCCPHSCLTCWINHHIAPFCVVAQRVPCHL